MVDSEKERKGGKGTRQWANWGLSIMFVLFPFALPLKEREAGKKSIGQQLLFAIITCLIILFLFSIYSRLKHSFARYKNTCKYCYGFYL